MLSAIERFYKRCKSKSKKTVDFIGGNSEHSNANKLMLNINKTAI